MAIFLNAMPLLLLIEKNFMNLLMNFLLIFATFMTTNLEWNFGHDAAGADWRAINDGVMGGRSTGQLSVTDSSLLFSGELSFENNGGFVSFRAPFGKYDLSSFREIHLRYRSSGLGLALMLETSDIFFLPHFRLPLEKTDGEWKEVVLDMAEVTEYRLDKPSSRDVQMDEMAKLIRVGFISQEKKAVPFAFELDYLRFE